MKITAAEIKYVKEVAEDILNQKITDEEAELAYHTIKEDTNPDSADFYYELKNYFVN